MPNLCQHLLLTLWAAVLGTELCILISTCSSAFRTGHHDTCDIAKPDVLLIDCFGVFQCLIVLAAQEEFLSLLVNSSEARFVVSALKFFGVFEPNNDLRNDITIVT